MNDDLYLENHNYKMIFISTDTWPDTQAENSIHVKNKGTTLECRILLSHNKQVIFDITGEQLSFPAARVDKILSQEDLDFYSGPLLMAAYRSGYIKDKFGKRIKEDIDRIKKDIELLKEMIVLKDNEVNEDLKKVKEKEFKIFERETMKKMSHYMGLTSYLVVKYSPELRSFRGKVNELYKKHREFFSDNKKQIHDFPFNHGQRVFEFISAEFIVNSPYQLEKGNVYDGDPDLQFTNEGTKYFLECRTRTKTLISDYILLAKNDNKFLEISKILYATYELMRQKNDSYRQEWWSYFFSCPENICHNLKGSDKEIIFNKLGYKEMNKKSIIQQKYIENFKHWFYMTMYMLCNFRELLHDTILDELPKIISFPSYGNSEEQQAHFQKSLCESAVEAVVDKIKNPYFNTRSSFY